MEPKDRIIVELNGVDGFGNVLDLVESLAPHVGYFKVGTKLFISEGPDRVVCEIKERGGKVFYDGQFMGAPDIVAGASCAVTQLGVEMFSVHCLGGYMMMKAAVIAAKATSIALGNATPLVLGIILPTGFNHEDLALMGLFDSSQYIETKEARMENLVKNLAWLAQGSGLDGVIVLPKRIWAVRKDWSALKVITSSIYPEWALPEGGELTMTPAAAIKADANALIIGDPITNPPTKIGTPVDAAKKIVAEIASVL